eukprot:222539-Pelagomonas_calceolata.AAC.2
MRLEAWRKVTARTPQPQSPLKKEWENNGQVVCKNAYSESAISKQIPIMYIYCNARSTTCMLGVCHDILPLLATNAFTFASLPR